MHPMTKVAQDHHLGQTGTGLTLMILTTKMHDAVRDSGIGKLLSRLIKAEFERGGDTTIPGDAGNVIQTLWAEFMKGADRPLEVEFQESDQPDIFDKPRKD